MREGERCNCCCGQNSFIDGFLGDNTEILLFLIIFLLLFTDFGIGFRR